MRAINIYSHQIQMKHNKLLLNK